MKIFKSTAPFIPASHEDQTNPGVLKKVLFEKEDFVDGRVQMVNVAKLKAGRYFEPHYHEDMQEVFIITSGKVMMTINDESVDLTSGDAVIVPIKAVHKMTNLEDKPAEYIVFGIATGKGGKTVNV